MSRVLCDVDGTPCVRDRDGDLIPIASPEAGRGRQPAAAAPTPVTRAPHGPAQPATGPCADHGRFVGPQAAVCPACWADVKAGDRPRALVGRRLDDLERDAS